MNYPVIATAVIMLVALVAHVTVGYRESIAARPAPPANGRDQLPVDRYWVQNLCAFQMISIDLLALLIVLTLIGTTDLIPHESAIAFALAALFAGWGVACFLQLLILRRPSKDYLHLCQWAVFFACSALLVWGGSTG